MKSLHFLNINRFKTKTLTIKTAYLRASVQNSVLDGYKRVRPPCNFSTHHSLPVVAHAVRK